MTNKQIPNLKSLLGGVLLTLAFAGHMIGNVGQEAVTVFFSLLIGLPFAFLFLMFNNPKSSDKIEWGTVIAMPVCSIIWPILALAMAVGRPWNDKRWRDRNA
ncbi:MAG: hypothetical protein AAF483_23530, partial [Planctomycetota bacterium]